MSETSYHPDGIACMKCDRFVNEVDEDGMCFECSEMEESEKKMWEKIKKRGSQ